VPVAAIAHQTLKAEPEPLNQRLRPAVSEPVILMFSRQQVETGDITEPLQLLRRLTADRQTAIDFCGRISLVVDGYNDDPRELFEVPVPSRRQRSSKLRRMARMLSLPRVFSTASTTSCRLATRVVPNTQLAIPRLPRT